MTLPGQTQANDAEQLLRRQRVVELRAQGLTFAEIAEQMGISRSLVHKDFQASLTRVLEPAVQEYRAEQVARLRQMREAVTDVLTARHLTIQNGRVVRKLLGHKTDDEGNSQPVYGPDIEDDAPVLAAVDRLLKIDEAERKLLGLDAKPEVQITGALRYVITGMPAPGDGGELPPADGTDGDDADAGG